MKMAAKILLAHHGEWDCWGSIDFSRTVAGITKWFWVTIKGYLSYILPKFADLVPTSIGSGLFYNLCPILQKGYVIPLPDSGKWLIKAQIRPIGAYSPVDPIPALDPNPGNSNSGSFCTNSNSESNKKRN